MINNPYFQNVASEFIALFILIFLGCLFYRITGRRLLLAFFHVGQEKRFVTYLSRITIPIGGSLGVDGQPRSFAGPTFALTEVELIGPIQRLFNYITPGVDSLPGILKTILISDVTTEFLPSPLFPSDIDVQAPFLVLGSPAYNAASQRIQNDYNPLAKIESDIGSITVRNLKTMYDLSLGFVLRARYQSMGQIAYYTAGLTSVGTSGAAIYLIKNWRKLQKKYGNDNPFVVLLRFQSNDPKHFEVVAEIGQ